MRRNGHNVTTKPDLGATLSFCELCLQDELQRAQQEGRVVHVSELRQMLVIISRFRAALPRLREIVNEIEQLCGI